MIDLDCNNNFLTSLDVSSCEDLTAFVCDNNRLCCLNVKNGNNKNVTQFDARGNNLSCINVDDANFSTGSPIWNTHIDLGVIFSENCGCQDTDSDGIVDCNDTCPNDANNDIDGDGVCGDVDNCPADANADQNDADNDSLGDVCDACPNDSNNDIDGDGVCGDVDNCPADANADQNDADNDSLGDACDACPNDSDNDLDGDGVCGDVDNCPTAANPSQADADCDGVGDECDLCDGGDDSIDNNNDGLPDCAFFPGIDNIIAAWKCGNKNNKVLVCHIPPGNPANAHTICISPNAVSMHLEQHGDLLGPCGNSSCPPGLLDASSGNGLNSKIKNLGLNSKEENGFKIFPNPSNGHFTVTLANPRPEDTIYKLSDIRGKTIWTQKFGEGEMPLYWKKQFDLPGNNVYFFTVQSGNKIEAKKIMVIDR